MIFDILICLFGWAISREDEAQPTDTKQKNSWIIFFDSLADEADQRDRRENPELDAREYPTEKQYETDDYFRDGDGELW